MYEKDKYGAYIDQGIGKPSNMAPNYTTNAVTGDMAYAIKQAGGDPNAQGSADKYAESLLNRVGTVSANTGNVLTAADVQAELNRLGYQTSQNGDWTNVGGQSYLTSGSEYNNLKDTYNKLGLGNVNIYGGNVPSNYAPTNGNAIGSMSGGYSGINGQEAYMSVYQEALQKQLEQIEAQKAEAQKAADEQKKQAYVAMRLGQKSLANSNAASGLNDSGYAESSNIALNADYGNNLNTINQNMSSAMNDINTNYSNVALSGAGTMANMAQQAEANALAQKQWEAQQAQIAYENQWNEKTYGDSLEQQKYENQWNENTYGDAMAQQQYENQWNEKTYGDAMAQQAWENAFNSSKVGSSNAASKAEMMIETGIYNAVGASYLGITKSEWDAYINGEDNSKKKSSVTAVANAIGTSVDERLARNISDKYNISLSGAQEAISIANKYNKSVDEVIKDMNK